MKTCEVPTEAGTITLRRPSFKEMKPIGDEVRKLIEGSESATELLYSEGFEKLMRISCVDDKDFERLQEAPVEDVWKVWETYLDFSRFIPFFEESDRAQASRNLALEEMRFEQTQNRIDLLKKRGVVPKDFSLTDLMSESKGDPMALLTSSAGSSKPNEKAEKKSSKKP